LEDEMTSAIRMEHTGGPEVLRLVHVEQRAPKSGQAWIEHEAIGVNYLDVTQRNGAVPIPLPSGLGLEGAGRVTAIGPDVKNVAVGDRVGYALGPLGSYATGRLYPANRLVKLLDAIKSEDAAAVIFKGITAQYLIKSTFPVKSGTTVLLYGAAGALGQILAPWAKSTTVSDGRRLAPHWTVYDRAARWCRSARRRAHRRRWKSERSTPRGRCF
jgi:NADPH2:quinone reductase